MATPRTRQEAEDWIKAVGAVLTINSTTGDARTMEAAYANVTVQWVTLAVGSNRVGAAFPPPAPTRSFLHVFMVAYYIDRYGDPMAPPPRGGTLPSPRMPSPKG
jgi:hypothetical protein